ncbi:MAG TPA: hypothetical protein VHC97_20095 [Thermoanaerobaculia bacterium]|jgi:hypothetical protein|nr:hypothetical protein [Thermoanaerobaculia bacterium]
MKKGFVLVALCALTLAAQAKAERIYVPILARAGADGSILATQVRSGDVVLANLPAPKRAGLITLEAEEAFDVTAWTVDRSGRAIAEVPAFTDQEVYTAGLEVPLDTLPRPRAMKSLLVGAANLSEESASCQATFYARDGSRAAEIPFEVASKSLARIDGLAAARNARASEVRITCDQSFYPFAVAAKPDGQFIAKGIGPNGACSKVLALTPVVAGAYTANLPEGVFHEATKANPKGIVCISAPKELRVSKAVYSWDVTVGPWSPRDRSGVHNLGFFFLDRFRSGTIGNVNALGPNKNTLKFAQNVGMPAGSNTNAKVGYALQVGETYHMVYTFDAANKTANLKVSLNGLPVADFSKETKPGNNQTLIVKPFGGGKENALAMVSEFGNYLGQHHPEEATVGWRYANFRLILYPK